MTVLATREAVGSASVRPAKIVISGVTKRFQRRGDSFLALSAVDLDIAEGEFVSIVGPSGCGKSTLLYMLGGFVPASDGSMRIDGEPVSGPGLDRGVVFQEYALFPWLTVSQNIGYALDRSGRPRQERNEIVERYITLMGLRGFENSFPRELSGGMKQRVALARTFAYRPGILLLDEPFGALDAQTREIMQDELLRLWKTDRKTVVMVTHDVDEAVYLSTRVCVMSHRPGRIVEEFDIALDRSGSREEIVLTDQYRGIRNAVWMSVRRQVTESRTATA
ncbi:ABC transporter ATP-binding protein [Bosea sp. (in: a-proteobacteria)]|jgi:NitT/TauT family transport system ATP-binding protein|uniref:ABC transporter ATP-binding protein n=1 Tax=Bosea sp. (in: a-proteobacteria) TaxID=1871050 RepID=UPI002DDD5BE1|nr:ABC transporter ATP-binding protein [Bosea sp. (in: a-proteobacteria)]HEV2508422.1 ABC transporter ATP-binding protein [Bosea sp. (in: a-proteobacteria)]